MIFSHTSSEETFTTIAAFCSVMFACRAISTYQADPRLSFAPCKIIQTNSIKNIVILQLLHTHYKESKNILAVSVPPGLSCLTPLAKLSVIYNKDSGDVKQFKFNANNEL